VFVFGLKFLFKFIEIVFPNLNHSLKLALFSLEHLNFMFKSSNRKFTRWCLLIIFLIILYFFNIDPCFGLNHLIFALSTIRVDYLTVWYLFSQQYLLLFKIKNGFLFPKSKWNLFDFKLLSHPVALCLHDGRCVSQSSNLGSKQFPVLKNIFIITPSSLPLRKLLRNKFLHFHK
jgi:hypothetical protein